ncbi:subtilisin-like protease 3 [Plasmodium gaboni]|uniref:subtilisin n=1 Tax=Plasmodium gaboni TaxID=647221 RepID=A0ABY1UJ76_9APIC|nr:subtilisin-like protease 3 [Plasmodium gaboni]
MINRHYFIWYIFIFNIINKIYFENIKYINYEVVVRKKKYIERGIGSNFIFTRRYYKNRLLNDVSYINSNKRKDGEDKKKGNIKNYINNKKKKIDNSYNYKNKNIKKNKTKIRKEQSTYLDKRYNTNINEKEEIKKKIKDIQRKRLIIHFKQDNNILSSRNYKHIFMKILSNCGHIEKLIFINFYLYEFPKYINNEEMILNICLRLLESRRINVEKDTQINHGLQMKSDNKMGDNIKSDNKRGDNKYDNNIYDNYNSKNSKINVACPIKDKTKELPHGSASTSTFTSISTSPYILSLKDKRKYENNKNHIFKINHSNKNKDNNNNNTNYHSNSNNNNSNSNHSSAKYQSERLNKKMIGTNILDGYDIIQIEEGMNLSYNYEVNDVNVCIIDTGIDDEHVDLKDNIIEKKEYMKKSDKNYNRNDNNNNNNIYNIDNMLRKRLFLKEKEECCNHNNSNDGHGHGTFIAGIIAGNSPKQKRGIKGISKKAKLIICKALNNNNAGYISDILECFNFCAKKKSKIINASFASTTHYPSLFQALKELQNKDILVISSSGNCSSNSKCKQAFQECNLNIQKLYPAAYSADLDNIISVSNMTQQSNGNIVLSSDSCYSPYYVHLAAPGGNIISTFPHNKYAISSGTSFSAAVITGLASLVLSINSHLNSQQVIEIFKNSIVHTKSLESKVKWGGFINVYDLVKLTIDSLPKHNEA